MASESLVQCLIPVALMLSVATMWDIRFGIPTIVVLVLMVGAMVVSIVRWRRR